jgi:opacity protein-like surface antigen
MKNIIAIAALAVAATSTPAFADSFTGIRVTGSAGYQDISRVPANRDFNYGLEAGYDVKVMGPVTVGVETGIDNVFDRTNVNVGARLGYEVNSHALVYAGLGYDNLRDLGAHTRQGLRVTGGLDVNVAGPFSIGAQYAHNDLGSTHTNSVAATASVRF